MKYVIWILKTEIVTYGLICRGSPILKIECKTLSYKSFSSLLEKWYNIQILLGNQRSSFQYLRIFDQT